MKTHPEAVPDGSARKGTNGAAGSAIAGLIGLGRYSYTDDVLVLVARCWPDSWGDKNQHNGDTDQP